VPLWVDKGVFRLPADHCPLICVGPGTGVAPLRSCLWQRAALAQRGHVIAPSMLFFGCRYQLKDYLYESEWHTLQQRGILRAADGLQAAFSRDSANKVYVQHLVRASAAQVHGLLQHNSGHVLVSGSADKMPAAVRDAFVDAVQQQAGCDLEQAKRFVLHLTRSRRYAVEAWS
jgi:sulfite reductase alpha subunit-like flavoprotein